MAKKPRVLQDKRTAEQKAADATPAPSVHESQQIRMKHPLDMEFEGGMHQACDVDATAAETETATPDAANAETAATGETEAAQAPSNADLGNALSKVTADYVAPVLTAEQLAAIDGAVKAFNALTEAQRGWFAQSVGLRTPKQAAEKKAKKAEVDPKLYREALKIFHTSPSEDDYATLAAAKCGTMPHRPSFADKKAEIYHQVIKSAKTQRLFAAVDSRDLDALEDQLTLMIPTHTANKVIMAYGKLALIAFKAQQNQQ